MKCNYIYGERRGMILSEHEIKEGEEYVLISQRDRMVGEYLIFRREGFNAIGLNSVESNLINWFSSEKGSAENSGYMVRIVS